MSIIISITLVNTRDLENCAAWAVLPYFWNQIYYFNGGGSYLTGVRKIFVNDLYAGVVPINICEPSKVKLWLFFFLFQMIEHYHQQQRLKFDFDVFLSFRYSF